MENRLKKIIYVQCYLIENILFYWRSQNQNFQIYICIFFLNIDLKRKINLASSHDGWLLNIN